MKRARLPAKPAGAEGLAGERLPVRLRVDGGQHPVRAHPVQEVDAGDPGPGADLRHRLGVGGRGQQAQRGPGARGDGAQPRFPGPVAGPSQSVVLGDKRVGERPARLPVAANDPLLSP